MSRTKQAGETMSNKTRIRCGGCGIPIPEPSENPDPAALLCDRCYSEMSDKTKWTPGPWTVDECPDANGHFTIRRADGTPNGNTDAQPIATVYREIDAALLEAAPLMAEALRRIARMTEQCGCRDRGGSPGSDCEWCIARAALRAAGVE